MLYRVTPWDSIQGEWAPEGAELRNHGAAFTAELEEQWPGSEEVVAAIGHVNGVRGGEWEKAALEAAMEGEELEVDLQVSWTNSPTLAVGRANDLREHLELMEVDRENAVDLSGVPGGGSTLERGGAGRSGLLMMAHVAAQVDRDPSGDFILPGWKDFGTEQKEDAFSWGESLREVVTLRSRKALKKAVVIRGGASHLMASLPRWASLCRKCRQRMEDRVGSVLDRLYRREMQDQQRRVKESMIRLKALRWQTARVPRRPRSSPFVTEEELKLVIGKLEAKELVAAAAKKAKLTLEMMGELEDVGGERILETELAADGMDVATALAGSDEGWQWYGL